MFYHKCDTVGVFYVCAQPLWRAAVSQFDRLITPAEQEAAGKLKAFIRDAQESPQQVHCTHMSITHSRRAYSDH